MGDRRKGLSGTWRLVKCAACEVFQIFPIPSSGELATYYAAYTPEEMVEIKSEYGSRYPALRKVFHFLSGDVDPRDFIATQPGIRMLDYGCGQATYLRYFHERGFDVHGAEITDKLVDASQAMGLRVKKVSDFSVVPFPDAEFDVVYLMQVFEHLSEPRKFMSELSRVLKPKGALYLAVPNASSAWRSVFGSEWVSGLFPPFHLAHYTDIALTNLASQFGLRRIDGWTRTPDSWFRLNLKAKMYPNERMLDTKHSWTDRLGFRILIAVALRTIEVFLRERDCLVMRFEKS